MNATPRLTAARPALQFLFSLPLLMMAGCGMVAAPQPPSLKLPTPVTDLTAQRTGNLVALHWTMPKRATDKVLLVGNQRAEVCRHVDSGPCVIAGNLLFAPLAAAEFTDHLPDALTSGPLRPLTYTVELENHAGRSAAPSNAALTAAGAAPAQVANLRARTQATGVLLSWTPAGGDETARIDRKLVEKPAVKKSELSLEQTLEFSGQDEGRVLDGDATLDHTYTYTAQRIAKSMLKGKSVEVASAPSESITINARDVFPPATPQGLQAVADPEARVIDLSWQPNTEPDLAGYSVYRREAGSNAVPVRISPPAQPALSFRDLKALPGHTYDYSVSAIDHDGNESQRSAEVEESLPQP
ncbi:MAG: fibronectin type III domain-containing protein [Silvibacterium sp.]